MNLAFSHSISRLKMITYTGEPKEIKLRCELCAHTDFLEDESLFCIKENRKVEDEGEPCKFFNITELMKDDIFYNLIE